ncbi:MAG: sugar ABC transporter ATP-binding protein [Firmicutes bacterium]|nr:sugar ABC transporter ATP-binding protein [Bacillota bacterium]
MARADQKDQLDVALEARSITKVYPGTVALDDVDFRIHRGKVNVLIGENGAGKSTLMKILAGVEHATAGHLYLDGEEVIIQSPQQAVKHGIGIIFQELNLFPNLSVAENIFAANEIKSKLNIIDHAKQEETTRTLLQRLERNIAPRALVETLRIGEQQLVEIAKALALDVKILIMDEPTSSLSVNETEVLFRIIEQLKSQGVSIVYISHRLDECIRMGDYFTVLRDGKLVAECTKSEVCLSWIVENMSGRKLDSVANREAYDMTQEVLKVSNLSLPSSVDKNRYLVNNVSFSLHAGEIIGIYGLVGAGRTELMECLMGLHPSATGSIVLDGEEISHLRLDQRLRKGITLIPEDRQRQGLVQKLSVEDNITLANLKEYLKRFYLSRAKEIADVKTMVKHLSIKVSNVKQGITSLSGGNQQKVVIAKNLLTEPKVLLMDEPTRGIDVGAKNEVFQIMNESADRGLGIIFVSSELEEITRMADRIIVMSEGDVTADCRRGEITESELVQASVASRERKRREANESA